MNVLSKIFDFILYGVIGAIGVGAVLLLMLFIYFSIKHPEVIKDIQVKHQHQMEGLLVNDGCLDPIIEKGFFDCPKNETSYKFKCTKNNKKLSGVLCEHMSSAYIRYDLNNFAE